MTTEKNNKKKAAKKAPKMTGKTLIQTQGLTRVYKGAEDVYALNNVDITINQGEFLSIVGPSGSGKSTLMNVLGLLDKPSSGKLFYDGEDIRTWNDRRQNRFRNEEIGFIFQAHLLMPEFTALENVLIPSRIGKTYGKKAVTVAKEILERIGLGDRTHHKPGELSGGQNQRVAIARALVNTPKVVFADEPTGALDSTTSENVYELMREINRNNGVTFVIVTHEKALAAKTDRMITLLDGEVESDLIQS